jgi:MFS family permease
MFLAFAVQGAWVPVFSVYLAQLGFSPRATSGAFITYALSSLVAPIAWGQIADRWVPAERCISLCGLGTAVLLAVLPALDGGPAVFFACLLFWFFMIPVNSLGAALTLRQVEHPERRYGRIRLWGTVGWVAGGLLLSGWLNMVKPGLGAWLGWSDAATPLADSFRVGALFAIVLSAYSLTLPATPPSRGGPGAVGWRRFFDAPLASMRLMRRPMFLTYCTCLFGAYVTYPFTHQLTPLMLAQLGVEREVLPIVLTISQSTEIATLALLPWLLGRLGGKATMTLGIAAWTLGLAVYAVGQPVGLVVAALSTSGVFICCFLVAGQVFVNRLSAPGVRASAQGLLVWISGTGLLAGHLLVGEARNIWTGDDLHLAFLPAAMASAVLLVVFVGGFRAAPRPKPLPESLVTSREMT